MHTCSPVYSTSYFPRVFDSGLWLFSYWRVTVLKSHSTEESQYWRVTLLCLLNSSRTKTCVDAHKYANMHIYIHTQMHAKSMIHTKTRTYIKHVPTVRGTSCILQMSAVSWIGTVGTRWVLSYMHTYIHTYIHEHTHIHTYIHMGAMGMTRLHECTLLVNLVVQTVRHTRPAISSADTYTRTYTRTHTRTYTRTYTYSHKHQRCYFTSVDMRSRAGLLTHISPYKYICIHTERRWGSTGLLPWSYLQDRLHRYNKCMHV